MEDKRKRIGSDIFIYLGEALLYDVTEYGLHLFSFAERIGSYPNCQDNGCGRDAGTRQFG